MPHENEVGGLRCSEVLERLSDYLDGEIDEAMRAKIVAHLEGCEQCEQLGGEMGRALGDLRDLLASPEPIPDDARARLKRRLDEEMG